jgi:manganese/iron transport system permease protein
MTNPFELLLAPLHYPFMVRALLAACTVGALCSLIGTFVVLRRIAFIGDGIAHASFAGIVLAYGRGVDYLLGAAVVAVLSALGISYIHRRGGVSIDTAIGVIFTGAFALGVFMMSRMPAYGTNLEDLLFGNILGVSAHDLLVIGGLAALVLAIVCALFRPLIYTSFDPVVAEASGIRAGLIDQILLVMLALTIVVSLRAVGIVLVAALLVTPAAAAALISRRFVEMLSCSVLIGVGSAVGGLYASYYLQSASGATIVLVATFTFFAILAFRAAKPRRLAGLLVALLSGGCAPHLTAHGTVVDRPAPEIRLPTTGSQPFLLSKERGKVVVLFFGYTHCGDVCPTVLAHVAQALALPGKRATPVATLFISVDPRRDTRAVTERYARSFRPDFIGLTGTPREIAAIERDYHVWSKALPPDRRGNYDVSHSSELFLIAPDGRLRILEDWELPVQELAEDIHALQVVPPPATPQGG